MLGIDFLMAGTLLTLAAASPQKSFCSDVMTAKINVLPKTADIEYDHSRSLLDIQDQQMDTINPYDFHNLTITQGFMQGIIKMSAGVKLSYKEYPRYDAVCYWYDKIDINIQIEPKIVIAKEVYNDSCMRKAVIDHEMKHVTADRKIVNKYSKIMGAKVYDALQERGFKASPVRMRQGPATAARMQDVVRKIVEHEYKKLDIERIEAQRDIDNIKEYDRVSAQCPEFQKKLSGWMVGGKTRKKSSR